MRHEGRTANMGFCASWVDGILFPNLHKVLFVIEYLRKPTREEIKFGYGTLHFRDFEFDDCFDKKGYLKKSLIANDDRLKYYR